MRKPTLTKKDKMELVPTVYINQGKVSMVKSFDGLLKQIRKDMKREPKVGELFVFCNKARDKVKMFFQGDGEAIIFYKRLDEGTFILEGTGYKKITHVNPLKLLGGIDLNK